MTEIEQTRTQLDELMRLADSLDRPDASGHSLDEVTSRIELVHSLAEARDALDKYAAAVNVELERTKAPVHQCRCTDTDISKCPIHTVDHYFYEGCCDQPENSHRHMTDAEFERDVPLVFDKTFTADDTDYRVYARKFRGKTWGSLVRLFPKKDGDSDDERAGLGWDFSPESVPGLIAALKELEQASA